MTIERLVTLVADAVGEDGVARRCRVREAYGVGFEGAIRHAVAEQVVVLEPSGDGIALTDVGKRMARDDEVG